MRTAALSYAAVGWRVFPINAGTKLPLTEHGHLDATDDAEQVAAWWAAWPDARIGVHLRESGLVAIDVDIREGVGDGHVTLAELEAQHGPLPRDLVQRSGGGGTHIILADPDPGPDGWTRTADTGGRVNAKPGKLIDFKVNGYIVLAPSGRYMWQHGAMVDAAGHVAILAAPPPVPAAWIDVLRKPEAALLTGDVGEWATSTEHWCEQCAARLRGELRMLERRQGTTDPTVLVVRKIFHDYGRSIADGSEFLEDWNADCGKPYDGHELSRQLHRCARHDFSDTERGWAAQPLLEPPPPEAIEAALAGIVSTIQDSGKNSFTDDQTDAVDIYPDDAELDAMVSASAEAGNPYVALDANGFECDAKGQRKPSPANVARALLLIGTDIRYNDFARIVEVDGVRATDHVLEELRFRVHSLFRFSATPPVGDFHSQVSNVIARARSYHPVREYLGGLAWDGEARLDSWLPRYCRTADTPYTRAVGRLVLIAACRRVREPGCKFDEMLVLEGPTGYGKQRVLKILAVHRDWYTDDLPLGEDSKIVIEQTRGRWIVEIPELVGMSKHDHNKLKSCLSRDNDVARAAYAREVEEHPRQFIMIATTNEYEYLSDRTGNRRWWPVRLLDYIDLDGIERDRDQLWAEAAAAEAAGESIRLDASLWGAAAEQQEQRRAVDPYEIKVAPLADERIQGRILIADAWALAGCGEDPTPVQQRRVAAALQALGWIKARATLGGDRVYCYQRGVAERWWNVAEVRGLGNNPPDLRVVQ